MHGSNTVLSGHLLETAFALLRNAGHEPVDIMCMVYHALTDAVDVSPLQQEALHDYLRRVVADHNVRLQQSSRTECEYGHEVTWWR